MTPREAISDAILFVYPLRGALAKVRAVSHETAQFVLKITHLAISMETTQLRLPTPILEFSNLKSQVKKKKKKRKTKARYPFFSKFNALPTKIAEKYYGCNS